MIDDIVDIICLAYKSNPGETDYHACRLLASLYERRNILMDSNVYSRDDLTRGIISDISKLENLISRLRSTS